MINLGEAYRKDEQKTVRAARADRGKTKKRRTINEEKTKKRRRKDEEKTKKRRTMNEQKTVRSTRANREKTNKKQTMSEGKRVVIGNKKNSRFCEKCKNESCNE